MGCENPVQAIAEFRQMMVEMELRNPVADNKDKEDELIVLSTSVNPVRLKNNPVALENGVIYQLYDRIVNQISQ